MLLLVGLGNPGPKYAFNRHNIGFLAIDRIASLHGFGPARSKFQGLTREGVIETDTGPVRTLLLTPQTFMNDSGRAVAEAARFHKIPPEKVVVFHDELDLAPGRFRMKTGGGHAGHNGLRSIMSLLPGDFRRARMGIGHPGDKAMVHAYVLSDFYKIDEDWVANLCDACARALPMLAKGDDERYQTEVLRLAPAPKADPRKTGRAEGDV